MNPIAKSLKARIKVNKMMKEAGSKKVEPAIQHPDMINPNIPTDLEIYLLK